MLTVSLSISNFKKAPRAFLLTFCFIALTEIFFYSCARDRIARLERLPNVRLVRIHHRLPLIEKYLDLRAAIDKDAIVILGDSPFYGVGLKEQESFPALLNGETKVTVLNLSFPDARPPDALKILKIASEKLRIQYLIWNFNLAHYAEDAYEGERYLEEPLLPLFQSIRAFLAVRAYFWNDLKSRSVFWNDLNATKRQTETASDDLVLLEYGPKRYQPSEHNQEALLDLMRFIREKTESHLIVMSPHCLKAIEYSHYDTANFLKEIARYGALLRGAEMNVLDLSFQFADDQFFDIIHLNHRGHRKLAALLQESLPPSLLQNTLEPDL